MTMLLQTLTHTPAWVLAVLLLLLILGVRQMQTTRVHPARLAIMPVAMTALSFYGVVSAFGLRPAPVGAWLAGVAFALTVVMRRPLSSGVQWDPVSRAIQLPGSSAPLVFMMGIFFTKYAVNVALATNPTLRYDAPLQLVASALYGGFTGLFAGRALRVVRHLFQSSALH